MYVQLKQSDKAVKDYDTAISLDPNGPYVYIKRGIEFVKLKQYQKAIDDLDKALSLEPNDNWLFHLYYFRAVAHRNLKQLQPALDDFDKALAQDSSATTFSCRGWALLASSRVEDAISDFNTAIGQRSKRSSWDFAGLSSCYKLAGRDDLADEFEKQAKTCSDYSEQSSDIEELRRLLLSDLKLIDVAMLRLKALIQPANFENTPHCHVKDEPAATEKEKHASELLALGNRYLDKPEPSQDDYKKAFDAYQEASLEGNPCAQNNLALRYEAGQGTTRNVQMYLYWLRKAAAAGCGNAMCNLGIAYRDGTGVERDPDKFVQWCKEAVDKGYAGGYWYLARAYEAGQCVPKDWKQALFYYEAAAARDEPQSMARLAFLYRTGENGVPLDLKRSFAIYKRAAELDNAYALGNVGLLYSRGVGVKSDPQLAEFYLKTSWKRGERTAALYLAELYLHGPEGFPPQPQKAGKWLEEAASTGSDQNAHQAASQLVEMYKGGQLPAPDQALEHMRSIDKHGIITEHWAMMLVDRNNPQDQQKGAALLQEAAAKGCVMAEYNLGLLYESGVGVEKDLKQAKLWIKRAADAKDPDALRKLESLDKSRSTTEAEP